MIRLILPLLTVAALLLIACAADERYPSGVSPHETWKDRGEYCFFVEVDPGGADNRTLFWADEVAVSYKDSAETGVKARNVRVSEQRADHGNDRGNAKRDFFQPGIQRVLEDGSISIDERCFGEAP